MASRTNRLCTVFLFLALMAFSFGHAQKRKYILLDMLDSAYTIKQYTLSTAELYGTDDRIELFNVYIDEQSLILFSVLPGFDNTQNWEEVDKSEIEGAMIQYADFNENYVRKIRRGVRLEKSFSLRIVRVDNGRYLASKLCLFEQFNIREYHHAINTPPGTININRPPIDVVKMQEEYLRLFPDATFPSQQNSMAIVQDRMLIGMYLSKELCVNNRKAYFFWVFDDWNVVDGPNIHRGIDRFIYIPELGIVGGSYDFHFAFGNPWEPVPNSKRYRISPEQWQQNVMEEKVMLAEELK